MVFTKSLQLQYIGMLLKAYCKGTKNVPKSSYLIFAPSSHEQFQKIILATHDFAGNCFVV